MGPNWELEETPHAVGPVQALGGLAEGRVKEALSGGRHTRGQHALGSLTPGGGDRGAGVQTALAEHGEVTVREPFCCADLSA